MSIKCGRGNHYHENVEQVKACYNGQANVPQTAPTQTGHYRATDRQVRFLAS